MPWVLKIVEGWCRKKNPNVNPKKTALVPFTKLSKLDGLRALSFFGNRLLYTRYVKYLGLKGDAKLTLNVHMQKTTNSTYGCCYGYQN